MIFDALHESAQRGELLLIEGGFCHWHLRRDGQLTIREIISTQLGAGNRMLDTLKRTPGATCIAITVWFTAKAQQFRARSWS